MVVDYGRRVKGSEWAPTSAPIWMDGDWMSNFVSSFNFFFVLPTLVSIVQCIFGGLNPSPPFWPWQKKTIISCSLWFWPHQPSYPSCPYYEVTHITLMNTISYLPTLHKEFYYLPPIYLPIYLLTHQLHTWRRHQLMKVYMVVTTILSYGTKTTTWEEK
jgi:hypothetical protein